MPVDPISRVLQRFPCWTPVAVVLRIVAEVFFGIEARPLILRGIRPGDVGHNLVVRTLLDLFTIVL